LANDSQQNLIYPNNYKNTPLC